MRPEPRYKKDDRIGGRYLVHKALMGGMGEVYLCLDLEENYPYALKTFQQRYLTDSQRLRWAFEQEVATWVALEKHPNIVRCFHMATLDRQPFMILEWVAGEEGRGADLRGWLRHGPLALKLALQIAIDLCYGLLHAQAKRPGLVHRDLKPENILMAQEGVAKITDFGLAQMVAQAGLAVAQEGVMLDSRQSLVGGQGITGTPAYMAPEQWRNEALDARTDLYAVGVIFYELLTGSVPFAVALPSTTPQGIESWLRTLQHAHEEDEATALPSVLPAALNDLVQRCLAKPPAARYPSLAALLHDLTSLYQAHCGEAPPSRPTPDAFTATDHNNRGVTYAGLQQHEAALADYSRSIELDSTFALAYANRGSTYTDLQQHEAALADYRQAITLNPTYALAYYNRGNTYTNLQQHEAALADYGRALALDSFFVQAYVNRGSIYRKLQQYEAALADYSRAIDLDPTFALAYANRGATYTNLQQHEAALADYGRALVLDPSYVEAYTNRGSSYKALQEYEAALADYSRSIELDSTFALAYVNRGATYTDLQQHEAALADYRQAITLDPAFAQVYYNRGRTYAAMRNYAAALADFTQAIALDHAYTKAYYNRGNIYRAVCKYGAALADFTCVLELDPTFALAYNNRGLTYANLRNYTAALADFTQAIALDPADVKAYTNRGNIYQAIGEYIAALADYTQAIALDPTLAQAYNNRGGSYKALQEYEAALADYDRALDLDPAYAFAYHNRGNTYVAVQDEGAALADFSRAIELDPTYAKAYLNIGALLYNQGRFADALAYFEQAAQLGEPQGTEYAARSRQRAAQATEAPREPAEQAWLAFVEADTLAAMQQAVIDYPLLAQADFIAFIEEVITQEAPPEVRDALAQQLVWLRQLAAQAK